MNCVSEKPADGPAVFKDEEALRAELPEAERGLDHPPSLYSTTYIRNKAEDFLRRHAGPDATPEADAQPWFLYLAPTAPHRGGPQAGFENDEVVDVGDTDVPVPRTPTRSPTRRSRRCVPTGPTSRSRSAIGRT